MPQLRAAFASYVELNERAFISSSKSKVFKIYMEGKIVDHSPYHFGQISIHWLENGMKIEIH